MQDLSPADPLTALVPTSQDGGNVPHGSHAMTAPGSEPAGGVDAEDIGRAPRVTASGSMQPGDNGRPDPREGLPAGHASWAGTGTA